MCKLTTLVILVFELCLVAFSSGEIIYRETFDNTAGQTALDKFGWYAGYGNNAAAPTLCAPGASGTPATAMSSGGPSAKNADGTYPVDINAGPSGPSTSISGGYLPNQRGFVTTPCMYGLYDIFVYTTEYTINQSVYRVDSISFCVTSSGTWTTSQRDAVRVAVQIASNWYVTAGSVTPFMQTNGAGTTFTNEAVELSLAADQSWNTLTFSPDSPLAIAEAALPSLPSEPITGFGLFWDLAPTSDRNTPRWDTFSIAATSVPEPASLLLLIAGSLSAVRRGRK